MVRERAARDLPGSEARRARRHLGVDRRPTSTCRTSGRRRTAATPTSAGSSCPTRRARPAHRARPAAPGLGGAPPRRRPRRRDPRRGPRARAETIVHLDAAHRGLGTASCGPDTLPEYVLGPGAYRWAWTLRDIAGGPDRCRSNGPPSARVPPAQRPDQLRPAGPRGRLARPPVLRRGARRWTVVPALDRTRFEGFSNRVGEPVALAYPTTGGGDYRVPA